MRIRKMAVLVTTGCLLSVAGAASTIYNESTSGDLANTGTSATLINFTAGSNQVIGTTGRANATAAIDRDYFTFTVPIGLDLVSIIPLPGTQVNGAVSFIGLQSGNTVTVPTNPADATGLLGWWHYSTSDVGTDILSKMATPSMGSSGFKVPLGPGSYSVWIQDFSVPTVSYAFDFQLQAVPEPGTMLPAGIAVVLAAFRYRRNRC